MGYDVIEKLTGSTVIIAETEHCFTTNNLKPVNLKKYGPNYDNVFKSMFIKNKSEC